MALLSFHDAVPGTAVLLKSESVVEVLALLVTNDQTTGVVIALPAESAAPLTLTV